MYIYRVRLPFPKIYYIYRENQGKFMPRTGIKKKKKISSILIALSVPEYKDMPTKVLKRDHHVYLCPTLCSTVYNI